MVIGVFDSGVGGLSVLRHLPEHVPQADIFYVADQANAPYGTKTLDEVAAIAHDVSARLIEAGASTVVVACNTASAAALDELRTHFPGTAFVGMEPAIKPAVGATSSGVIGILATGATFQSVRFENVVRKFVGNATIHTAPCPEWVDLVERAQLSGPDVERRVASKVAPMLEAGADTLVLGCTHFPFLEPVIRQVVGRHIRIIDPSWAVARQVARVDRSAEEGRITMTTTGDPDVFNRVARSLLHGLDTRHDLAFVHE